MNENDNFFVIEYSPYHVGDPFTYLSLTFDRPVDTEPNMLVNLIIIAKKGY